MNIKGALKEEQRISKSMEYKKNKWIINEY